MPISKSDIFETDIRLSRFIFNRVLFGIFKFVEGKGYKSQALAVVDRNNFFEKGYVFIEN